MRRCQALHRKYSDAGVIDGRGKTCAGRIDLLDRRGDAGAQAAAASCIWLNVG
jgi:hypothetical protein